MKARGILDHADKIAVYHRIHSLIFDDQPCLFLFTNDVIYAVDKRVRGITPTPAGLFHNLSYWFIPKEMQEQ
ncbi:MAG: hypothetical protein PHQ23_06350 [Candidatus Wallbacteria bacterium]|nr:hypothetical protein [Candidatus Wallbacteria bacterium]